MKLAAGSVNVTKPLLIRVSAQVCSLVNHLIEIELGHFSINTVIFLQQS